MDITRAAGYTEVTLRSSPKSTLLIDGNTGDVLWEENADEGDVDQLLCLRSLFGLWSYVWERFLDTVITATPNPTKLLPIFIVLKQQDCWWCWLYRFRTHHYDCVVPSSNVTTVMLANYSDQ